MTVFLFLVEMIFVHDRQMSRDPKWACMENENDIET